MKKKILAACLVVCLLATAVIGTTLAYFTDTETKTNTFTTGKVEIALSESDWEADNAKLIPGREIQKNPTITVLQGSERAWVFAKVELSQDFYNLMEAYAAGTDKDLPTAVGEWFKTTGTSPKLMKVVSNKDEHYAIFGYGSDKGPNDPDASVTLFDAITVPTDLTQDMVKGTNFEIKVTAYAIQSEGLKTRDAAFEALFPEF